MNEFRDKMMPEKMRWLPVLVLLVNMGVVGLLITHSLIGLKPSIPPHDPSQLLYYRLFTFVLAVLLPTAASAVYLWPVFNWLGRVRERQPEDEVVPVPAAVVERAANAPVTLAVLCLLTWILVDILLVARVWTLFSHITLSMGICFFIRP